MGTRDALGPGPAAKVVPVEPSEAAEPARTATGAPVAPPVNIRSTSLGLIALILSVAALDLASDLFAPLVLGVLISYAWYPVVSFLDRWRVPRAISAALVVALLVTGSWLSIGALQAQALVLLEKLPTAIAGLRAELDAGAAAGPSVIDRLREAADELEAVGDGVPGDPGADTGSAPDGPDGTADPGGGGDVGPRTVVVTDGGGASRYTGVLLDGSLGVLVFAGQALTILLFVYFVLASGNLYRQKLVRVAGHTLSEKKMTVQILDEINGQLRKFFFVMLVGALFVWVFTSLAFWWLGMEEALLWGVIAGFASVVPYAGPGLVFVASGLTAFLQFGDPSQALIVAGASLAITSVQGNLLTPWMTSRAASMNAVAVFVSLLFWGWLWGPIGLVVATPIQMIIKTVCDHVENLRPFGEFLGGRDPVPADG